MLMVLGSLAVSVLVILAVFLLLLQCWRFKGKIKKMRKKLHTEGTSESRTDSDSDYSSYTGEEDVGEMAEQSTVFSERTEDDMTNEVFNNHQNVECEL